MLALMEAGIQVKVSTRRGGVGRQAEIDFEPALSVQTGRALMAYKYVVKNVCHDLGYTATFMPKPLFGDNARECALVGAALERRRAALLNENGYALLWETAQHYIAELIAHAPALLGPVRLNDQSSRRLVPGFEARFDLMSAAAARSAGRIPAALQTLSATSSPKARAVEFPGTRIDGQPICLGAPLIHPDSIRKLEPPRRSSDILKLHGAKHRHIRWSGARLARRGQ